MRDNLNLYLVLNMRHLVHFGWFAVNDGGKLERLIRMKILPILKGYDKSWEIAELRHRGLHASLIVKGPFELQFTDLD